jgi:hypothetical protein
MPSYPLVNGTRYDWSSAGFKMGGADEYGFKEISYTDTIDRGEVRGVGPQVIGHTRGEYKAEGSFVMLKEEFDAWVAKTGDGWMETKFDISVSYAAAGAPTVTDQIVGCAIAKVETNPSNGTDPLEVSCDLTVTYIIRNGKKPLANMRT